MIARLGENDDLLSFLTIMVMMMMTKREKIVMIMKLKMLCGLECFMLVLHKRSWGDSRPPVCVRFVAHIFCAPSWGPRIAAAQLSGSFGADFRAHPKDTFNSFITHTYLFSETINLRIRLHSDYLNNWGKFISEMDPLPENSLRKPWPWGGAEKLKYLRSLGGGELKLLWRYPFAGPSLPWIQYVLQNICWYLRLQTGEELDQNLKH